MKIRIMPFLSKQGNRVAKAAIEFDEDSLLAGTQLVGFTICDDPEKGLFLLFPSAKFQYKDSPEHKTYFFLWQLTEGALDRIETAILDTYESMIAFNQPHVKNGK